MGQTDNPLDRCEVFVDDAVAVDEHLLFTGSNLRHDHTWIWTANHNTPQSSITINKKQPVRSVMWTF